MPTIRPVIRPVIRSVVRGYSPNRITLAQLLAKAGPLTAHYDLRNRRSLTQDGTTPITASGQPLGRVTDLTRNGNDAQALGALRPEYWVDPVTGEPTLWYNFVDQQLDWPTIAGARGTFCVAYTTGAQVFDITAVANVPPGPIVEAIFFDYILTDAECAAMYEHLNAKLVDTSWYGYATGTSYDCGKAPPESQTKIIFSVDGSKPAPAVDTVFTLTVPRQRFKIKIGNPDGFDASPNDGPFGLGTSDSVWLRSDMRDMLSEEFDHRVINNSAAYSYGALNALIRASEWPLYSVYFTGDTYEGDPVDRSYREYIEEVSGWVAPATLRRFYSVEKEEYPLGRVFTAPGAAPNFDAATKLIELSLRNFEATHMTGLMPPIVATLESYVLSGYADPQPIPPVPAQLPLNLQGNALTGMVDFTGRNGQSQVYMSYNNLSGVVPSFTAISTGIPTTARAYRMMFDWNPEITGYAGGLIPPPTLPGQYDFGGVQIRFTGAKLDQASVDAVFAAAVNMNVTAVSPCRCYMHQGTNATPSAAGLADVATLRARGWTVYHN